MALSNNYSVYKHTNKQNGKVYIGITKQAVERRWQKGCGYAGTYFGNAINKYGWDGFSHEVLFTGLRKETACKIEIALIKAYRSNQHDYGYNISEGGETADAITNKFGKDHPNSQRVKRIDPITNEEVIFDSISDAERDMLINHRGISKACRGISATYKGYIWEYVDKDYQKKPSVGVGNYDHVKICKKIKMVDANGRESIYESIKAAGTALGIRPSTISRYLHGLRIDSSGRRWSFCL
jgi:group I intron endonuclease